MIIIGKIIVTPQCQDRQLDNEAPGWCASMVSVPGICSNVSNCSVYLGVGIHDNDRYG